MSLQVKVYGQFSPPFVVSFGVRQGRLKSPFLFKFVIDLLQNALSYVSGDGDELLPGNSILLEVCL